MNLRRGLVRLQLVYLVLAMLITAFLTVQAGGDEHRSGWERVTQPMIVYWVEGRDFSALNSFWVSASLSANEAREMLIAQGRIRADETIFAARIYTWNAYQAWPVMWTCLGVALGLLGLAYAVAWIIRGFRPN